jgi:hypothetical protein
MSLPRIIAVLFILSITVIFSQCKKEDSVIDRLTQFNYETDYVVRVPATPVVAGVPLSVVTPEIKTRSDEAFSANSTRADMIERISLTALTLTVQSPSNGSLRFLKSVDIHAVAEGLPEIRIAYKDLVPDNVGTTLDLDVTNAELKEYFKKDKYSLRITVVADETVPEEHLVNAHGVFFVDAKVLGQ